MWGLGLKLWVECFKAVFRMALEVLNRMVSGRISVDDV